jgi:hypothetical protein
MIEIEVRKYYVPNIRRGKPKFLYLMQRSQLLIELYAVHKQKKGA